MSQSSKKLSAAARSARDAVRWYVMVSPGHLKCITSDLERELAYRRRHDEPEFVYFAPSFTAVHEEKGRLVETEQALLFNYFFLHASEREIYRMKQRLPQYNFLPRVADGEDGYHYPYLTDAAMHDLQWIARSYAGQVPLCTEAVPWLVRGDRVRITEGELKGMIAQVVTPPRSRRKEVMVRLDGWMWVPLLQIEAGQYEVVGLSDRPGAGRYGHLNNEQLLGRLHAALCRWHRGETTAEDRALAAETVRRYASLQADTDILRSKLYVILLQCYTILEEHAQRASLQRLADLLLAGLRAEQARVQLLVALYGCTDSRLYYDQAHAAVAPWGAAADVARKSRAELLRRLEDYDRILGHDAEC